MKLLNPRNILASRRRIIAAAIACLILLGYVDWSTGPNVLVTCFYFVPVCLLSWFLGKRVGYAVAAIYALIWLAIDLETIPVHSPLLYWNAVVRFITLAVVVWLIDLCRNLNREIEKLVEDKTAVLQRELQTRTNAENAIRTLAAELSSAEDAERRRLGQELHDAFGQSLTVLKLQLQTHAARLESSAERYPELEGSLSLVSALVDQARTLTFELYPSMLDTLGLPAALEHYAAQLSEQTPAQIRLSDSGPPLPLPPPLSAFLFRAVKELITNALKHGRATEIILQLRRRDDGHLRIAVSDNGAGLPATPNTKPGLGIPWIRERIKSFGGSFALESTPTQGARAIIDLNLTPSPEKAIESKTG